MVCTSSLSASVVESDDFLALKELSEREKDCVLTPSIEKAPCEGEDQLEPCEKVDRVDIDSFFAINSQKI